MLEHNGKIVRGKGYITDDLTDKAIAFIEENKDDRFFCYVPYNSASFSHAGPVPVF